jgi:hypothetical protein
MARDKVKKDQIKRAKQLFSILFPNDTRKSLYSTTYGVKTNTGVINTILNVMYDYDKNY